MCETFEECNVMFENKSRRDENYGSNHVWQPLCWVSFGAYGDGEIDTNFSLNVHDTMLDPITRFKLPEDITCFSTQMSPEDCTWFLDGPASQPGDPESGEKIQCCWEDHTLGE